MGFIDIHTHIIPNVDDGAKGFDEAIVRIRGLHSFGIDTIIATPHKRGELFDFDEELVKRNFNLLSNRLIEEGIGVKIYLGAEYYFGVDLFEDIGGNTLYTLGNSKYILVEFKSLRFSQQDRERLFRIFTSGYKIVVAHIERHRFNSESFSTLEYLKNNSALFQCDIMSLSGLWGEEARLFMEELLNRNLVDVIATDVHCKEFESGLLEKGFSRLKELRGDGSLESFMGEVLKKRLNLL
ncbi:MAG: tyrosine-protein phosphatase [Myxococcota bacterium]